VTARLRVGACLSLTGRFARFGRQAAAGLEAWRSLTGAADVLVEDDRSDRNSLRAILPGVAARCDLLLGPYSTVLMREAGRVAADAGRLVWNHGGSGDDVEGSHAGHVISVLTPASRYAGPFLRHVASGPRPRDLVIIHGAGSFGRQVAAGAAVIARQLGIRAVSAGAGAPLPPPGVSGDWDLFSAGVFEQDARLAARARQLPDPPRRICAIAAGVRDFAGSVSDPEGVFGIAQWLPGTGREVLLGPQEAAFLSAYAGPTPDYPAVQAAAGAVLAVHCAGLAGGTASADLWAAAATLDTSTLFGRFGIDPRDGVQIKHDTLLVRWAQGKLVAIGALAGG
jgi:hypothetical protein